MASEVRERLVSPWIPQYSLDRQLGFPSCTVACPLHTDVQGYINLMAQGRFAEALALIRETNPLAYSLGIVCPHPCEAKCRRAQVDQSVAICALKRAAAEHGWEEAPTPLPIQFAEKVAIIGAGPAGLTTAYDLLRLGYRVTVFDKLEAAGGALFSGVPVYRLPKDLLRKDTDYLRGLGVEIRTGVEIGKDLDFDDLFNQGFAAVIVSVGLTVSRSLNIPGSEAQGVLTALPFLSETNYAHRSPEVEGKSVIVIGGGSVATDVARSAVRAGALKVKLVCLEARDEMPAVPSEVQETLEEAVALHPSRGPKRIVVENGKIVGLETKAVVAVLDEQGRFNPTFDEDQVSVIAGDVVIIAIGQAADLTFLRNSGVELSPRGQLVVDPLTWSTTRSGVFACGDVAKGPGPAVAAMANARVVALAVHHFLRKGELEASPLPDYREVAPLTPLTLAKIAEAERAPVPMVSPEIRARNFDPVDAGFSDATAMVEAQRCLNCAAGAVRTMDYCASCLSCVRVCPYGIPQTDKYGQISIDLAQCQACGLCSRECPVLGISLRREIDIPTLFTSLLEKASFAGPHPVILALGCHYCAPASGAGLMLDFSKNVLYAKLMCLGKLDLRDFLTAFELGVDGLILSSCAKDRCHFAGGCERARRKASRSKLLLDQTGIGGKRLYVGSVDDNQGENLAESIATFTGRLQEMGPNPSRRR